MLLGKRPRPPIKRTTSMTGMMISTVDDPPNVDAPGQMIIGDARVGPEGQGCLEYYNYPNNNVSGDISSTNNGFLHDHRFLATMVSPRNQRRNSADFLETADFLTTCGRCNRRLAPGKDIYMYRGDSAFCSLECREEQMKQDERKEKCNVIASKKEDRHASSSSTTSSKASSKSETLAAA